MQEDDRSFRVLGILRQAEYRINDRRPEIAVQTIRRLKTRCFDLAQRTMRSSIPFLLVLQTQTVASGAPIVFDDPDPYIAAQAALPHDRRLIVVIDTEGHELDRYVESWPGADNWSEEWASNVSEDKRAVVFHIYGASVRIYESGSSMECVQDVTRPNYPFGSRSERHQMCHEYVQAVRNHFEECVQYERVVKYWADKARRRFVGGPEKIFQSHLWYYLNLFLLDYRKIDMEYNPDGLTDRTDIWIETVNDERYLLEIKWLGRSVSQNYGEERAHQGAKQVIEYLRRFEGVKKAALVMYDGRHEDVEIVWTDEDKHPQLDLSLRLYIVSETASGIARH